jgi:MFS family permease
VTSRRRSVLRERDVAILVGSTVVSVTGDAAALIALTLRLHAHGHGGWVIAALMLAGSAPMIVLSPLAGRLVDRIDSRTAIASSALAQAACAFALAQVTDIVATLLFVAVLAAASTVMGPAVGALLPRAVPEDRIVEASAHQQTAMVVGNLAGPLVGGLLTGVFDSRAPLIVDAISFLVVAGAVFLVRTRRHLARESTSPAPAISGVRVIWQDSVVRAVVVTMTALVLAAGAVNIAEVFLIKDALHASDLVYGVVSAMWMAGMVVGSALTPRFGRDTIRLLRMMALAEVVLAVGLIGAGVSPIWPLAAIAFVVGGLGNGALSVACRTIVTLRVPDEYRGRAFGVMTGSINAGSVVAFAAGGALVAAFGPRASIVGCGAAALVVGLVFVAYTRRTKAPTPTRTAEPSPETVDVLSVHVDSVRAWASPPPTG